MTQVPDSQNGNSIKTVRIKKIIDQLGLKQKDLAQKLGMDAGTIAKHLNGKRPIGKNVEYKILKQLNVNEHWWNTGNGEMFNPYEKSTGSLISSAEALEYEDLPYISTKARASFTELENVTADLGEVYRVMKVDPDDNYMNQVVIEIDGDSMEPNYWNGSKVRCKEMDQGDWQYLNSGVYAVVYGNFFVVKRVKNGPVNGKLTLHSDNIETGGCIEVPLSEIRKIWKVLRIVDAPAR
jgi:repressor LexA